MTELAIAQVHVGTDTWHAAHFKAIPAISNWASGLNGIVNKARDESFEAASI